VVRGRTGPRAVRSKDSISGKRRSRVELTPSLPSLFGSVSLAALISCRCPTDGANPGAGNPSFGDAPKTRAAHIHVALTLEARRSPPAGFLLRPGLVSFRAALALDAGGRRFGGILGLSDCAVSARIGLTGVKRAAIGCRVISHSIRARRTSDICFRTPSDASVEPLDARLGPGTAGFANEPD
jgi:hypothetical protein